MFTYVLYNVAVNSRSDHIVSVYKKCNEQWIGNNVEGSSCGVIWTLIAAFAWRNWEQFWKQSITAAVLAQTWTWDLPDVSHGAIHPVMFFSVEFNFEKGCYLHSLLCLDLCPTVCFLLTYMNLACYYRILTQQVNYWSYILHLSNTWEKMGIQQSSASSVHRLQESLRFS